MISDVDLYLVTEKLHWYSTSVVKGFAADDHDPNNSRNTLHKWYNWKIRMETIHNDVMKSFVCILSYFTGLEHFICTKMHVIYIVPISCFLCIKHVINSTRVVKEIGVNYILLSWREHQLNRNRWNIHWVDLKSL